ncbi:MAG: hypothetical protein ACLP01_27730 [Solirubrobacteraceae bacterium]
MLTTGAVVTAAASCFATISLAEDAEPAVTDFEGFDASVYEFVITGGAADLAGRTDSAPATATLLIS